MGCRQGPHSGPDSTGCSAALYIDRRLSRKCADMQHRVVTGHSSHPDLGLTSTAWDAREVGDKASYTGHHSIMKGKQPQVRFLSLTSARKSCLSRVPCAVAREQ